MVFTTAVYPFGSNNIVYKSKDFTTGKSITCVIWNPRMVESQEITLIELKYGLYYFTYDFQDYGVHNAIFLEDGMPTKFHAFRIVHRGLRLP